MKLQTKLEAEKPCSNALEEEKLNMVHTKCNVNLQDIMQHGSESKTWKGSTDVCNWHLQGNEHELKLHAVEEHQEERRLPNMDAKKHGHTKCVGVKINLGFLVSDNHLPTGRHNGSITEKWLRAEGTYIGTIAHTSAVMSTLPLKRSSIDMTVEVTKCTEAKCSHVTL